MIWFRDLLLGIFTRHGTTKLLALLLSLGLFLWVQASLRTTQELRVLTLRFTLVGQPKSEYVLLSDEVTFQNLLISGIQSKVDPLAKLYRSDPGVNVPIDRVFLKIYGEEPDDPAAVSVSIDTNDTRSTAETLFGPIAFRQAG